MVQDIGRRIAELRREKGLSQDTLAELSVLNRVTVARYESGKIEPGAQALGRIADALEVSVDELLGRNADAPKLPSGLLGIIHGTVPLIGEIACGTPITAQENIEDYVSLPDGVRADFALRCKGDSMAPTFSDGDIVLLRQESDVADGKIAAVLIDNEATLKRIHHIPNGVMLVPENTAHYSPMIYQGEDAAAVRIIGLAVGYVRMI